MSVVLKLISAVSAEKLCCRLSRLAVSSTAPQLYSIRSVSTTPILCGEPLKKKRRVDPSILRAREERKRKKIEKAIRQLKKTAKQLKPLDEMEVPRSLRLEIDSRRRENPPQTEQHAMEVKELQNIWSRAKKQQRAKDLKEIRDLFASQKAALEELRSESLSLYMEAIKEDDSLLGFELCGPVNTPPITNYDSPDGDYYDITQKWD